MYLSPIKLIYKFTGILATWHHPVSIVLLANTRRATIAAVGRAVRLCVIPTAAQIVQQELTLVRAKRCVITVSPVNIRAEMQRSVRIVAWALTRRSLALRAA